MNDITRQIILSGIILCLIGVIEVGIEVFAAPLTTDEILESEWTTLSYGDPAITMETPKEMKISAPKISKELWYYLGKLETYSYKESDTYRIIVSCAKFIPFGKVPLKEVAQVSIEELKNQKNISNVKFKEAPYILGKHKGITQYGSFEQNEQRYDFTMLYFGEGMNLWQLTLQSKNGDLYGRKVTEKILRSLRIDV